MRPAESKRIKNFRLAIIRQLPKFPNNRETLELLEEKSLALLLIDYANWMYRLVPPRPRSVVVEPAVTAGHKWKKHSAEIKEFLNKVRAGEDLAPNLSRKSLSQGFTPASAAKAPGVDKWADKDFLLNVMRFHHFHFSQEIAGGRAVRTGDVLFAEITRDKFTAVGIFGHSVFGPTDLDSHSMREERERLWKIFDERHARGKKPDAVYITAPITTSGHTLSHTRLAAEYAAIVYDIDSKLDDPRFLNAFFDSLVSEGQTKFKPRWHFSFLDLGIFEEYSDIFFPICTGPL
jgi:hypothetical protein